MRGDAGPERTAASPEARALVREAREVLQQLSVLIRNSHLHDLTNEVFVEPLEKLRIALERVLASEGAFRLERTGQEFFANGTRLRMELRSLHAYQYVAAELGRRGLGGFAFRSLPDDASLRAFLALLASTPSADGDPAARFNHKLAAQGVDSLAALPARESEEQPESETALDRRQRALNAYQRALDFIRESIAAFDSPAQVNVRRAKRTVQKLVDLSYEEGNGFSLLGLASIKDHDNYTFNHMVNVGVLAIAFGQRLGLPRIELAQLGLCALYHDMGKLHIPLHVLNKSGTFTEEEWAVMGNHTVFAARTLFPLVENDLAAMKRILTALQHHLRFDGKGYPKLRLFRRQTLFTRITSICDTFDAMTTKRIYQRQYLPDEALKVLADGAGTKYDPLLVKAFINCLGIFPVGSTVLLQTGELAVVVEANPDPEHLPHPKVKVVTDAAKRLAEPVAVDLALPEARGRQILHCVDPELFGINSAHYAI